MTSRVLYLFGSAAPPVLEAAHVVEDAQARGWDVCLGLTPTAARWLEPQRPELERLTGHPVRSEYKMPGSPDIWPKADVILVAPATFNTVNEWALGLTSKFVVGVAAEAIGKRIPALAMPCVNAAYVRHPQFDRSVEVLQGAGVRVLYGPGGFEPNEPGERRPEGFPWERALDAVGAIAGGRS
ncbi:flavoprotein [Streptomyces brevispora]|uniref:Flavoprotein n=1 Tax=Streptomyces brevispora TaxID=887462 RepID=A0A561UQN3_9ACTN|nr:flavoprotein [Streptomyces brevispora]TWG01661.1 flavoprotein [Streptomyces brevispora]WSC18090.1 flavoprotein [Streptomyces brevispora]